MDKVIFIIWIIVMCIDNILPLLISKYYKGYQHKTMALSVLGSKQSPIKLIYNIWCIISGVVFCIGGYYLYSNINSILSLIVFLILVIYGFGCEIISGFFPVNEKRDNIDLSTKIHGIGSVLGFTLLLFVPLLLGIELINQTKIFIGVLTLFCFVISFIFFVFFVMGDKDKYRNTFFSFTGLWQRLILIFCYVPIIVCITFFF